MTATGEGRAAARARRLLGAYPWRVRAEQGEEIVGTVLDALPPGADRLPWRVQLDLVRGGWRVRARRRPPRSSVIAYVLGFRLGPQWIGWVYDDLEDPDYVRVRRWRIGIGWVVALVVLAVVTGDVFAGLYSTGLLILSILTVPNDRARRRTRHGLAVGGSDPDQVWVVRRRPAIVPHLRAVPLLLALGLGLAVAGALALDAATRSAVGPSSGVLRVTIHRPAPDDVVGALAIPLVAGIAVAVLVVATAIRALLRSTDRAGRAPARGGWRLDGAAAAGGAALAVVAGVATLPVRWRWVAWAWAGVGAVALPLGVGLVVLGAVASALGRRRRAPVGLWDLVPPLGPRARTLPMHRWLVERTPGVAPWTPGTRPPSG